jgi:agmatinase
MPIFGDIPVRYAKEENAKVVILPAPFEGISTWLKGSSEAIDAIIEASTHMDLYDWENDHETYKCGIATAKPLSDSKTPDKAVLEVYQAFRQYLKKDKFVVMIAGDHTLSVGAAKALDEKYENLCVLQLDAHTELRQIYNRSKYNQACVGARLSEIAPLVQVGMRSMDISEKQYLKKGRHFFINDIRKDADWVNKVVEQLGPDVYISIDLDVLDPSIMPSTRHPEPNGLTYTEILQLLSEVFKQKNVVGCDFSEFVPVSGFKSPEYLVSCLIYKLIGFKFPKI